MENKVCTKCKAEKPATKDYFNVGRRQKLRSDCKACQNLKQSEAYHKKNELYKQSSRNYRKILKECNQKLIWNYLLEHPCTKCGETNPVVLEFDHLKDKKYCISRIIFSHVWESVLEEINKCQVLCSNCHKKKTAKDFKYYKHIGNIEKYL